ncbi:MAG: hypothetical protein SCARUB_01667 [Candidatus Scalindua rubra]|uniref:Uncharacterized protein n=1 Tax=Candidatus Scalindua rubra TaxID=1872076 RepID=A0A1E3XC52_9BACT|nr:MAG: hypothetical protein SCARUB_01667 [Candidatus Scalindua rubra]
MTATTQDILEKKSELLLEKMQEFGIKQNCQDYHGYIQVKKIVEDLASSCAEYEKLIRFVINFIKI